MNFRLITLVFAVAFSFLANTALFSQTVASTRQHTVRQGETLYRISQQYGVTVAELLRYNTGIKDNIVTPGQVLVVPTPFADEATPVTEYKVKRKDTLWGIAHAHGLTVDELVRANPVLGTPGHELKKGDIVLIPAPRAAADSSATARVEAAAPSAPQETGFPEGAKVVRVAVMLPFIGNSGIKDRCVEYYRGFLMAVDSMKRLGHNVEVFAYDTPPDASLAAPLAEVEAAGVQAVIGPFYGDHIAQVAAFAARNHVMDYVPFTSKATDVYKNPYLCLLNAPDAEKWKNVYELFGNVFTADCRLIVVRTASGNEKAFTDYMLARHGERGGETATVALADLSADFLSAIAGDGRNVVLPDASDQATLDRLMPILTELAQTEGKPSPSLLGYPDWQAYIADHLDNFYALDTYIFTNFYYDAYPAAVKRFERDYREWFRTDLLSTYPRMALLGFDNGLHILKGLAAYGTQFATQPVDEAPYQSVMRLERLDGGGGVVNNHVWLVNYGKDRQIRKIALK